jgi:hypothetical protein
MVITTGFGESLERQHQPFTRERARVKAFFVAHDPTDLRGSARRIVRLLRRGLFRCS